MAEKKKEPVIPAAPAREMTVTMADGGKLRVYGSNVVIDEKRTLMIGDTPGGGNSGPHTQISGDAWKDFSEKPPVAPQQARGDSE